MKIIVTTNDSHDTYEGEDLTPLVNDRELHGQLDITDGKGRTLGAYPAGRWNSVRVEGDDEGSTNESVVVQVPEGHFDHHDNDESDAENPSASKVMAGRSGYASPITINLGVPDYSGEEVEDLLSTIAGLTDGTVTDISNRTEEEPSGDGENEADDTEDKPFAYVEVAPDLSKIKQFLRDLNDLVNKY